MCVGKVLCLLRNNFGKISIMKHKPRGMIIKSETPMLVVVLSKKSPVAVSAIK